MSSKKPSDTSKREVSVSGMSFLRGSASYVWCTTSVLGKGATGAVYQGVNRHTGEPVAVKTFNSLSHMRPQEVQMREFEVLQKVNHENIVKLLAIEEEQEGRGKVIIMELCTGGSLFNILDDPENSYGLEESEFLLVLQHLAAGMKHLRDNSLVHRDLKPGNIMKFIDVDGSTIYKLTDFGAARELQDDQQFMSLYGTEEYLHPDMYERAVLRKPVGKTFGARVDLWSIGVTIYHVATGQLPFRPYGGRRNRETMHVITTEKSPGVISGVQTSENGPIEWSKELPETCQLSLGLCKLVTPLLGGLLEADPQRMWNFETFFSEVVKLLSRKVINVFYINRVQPLVIFMDTEHKYEHLQYLICEQTDVVPSNQLLLYDNKLLLDIVGEDLPGKSFPVTSPRCSVVLFSKQEDDVNLYLPTVPALKFPSFSNMVSVEHDAAVGKSICSVGYAIKRRIEYFCKCIFLVEYSVFMFIEVIIQQLRNLNGELTHLEILTNSVSDRFGQLVVNHRKFLMVLQLLNSASESLTHTLRETLEDLINNKVEDEKAVRDSLSFLSPIIKQLNNNIISGKLKRQWQPAVGSDASSVERIPNTAATYVLKLRESWQHLLRDRAARNLTFNDEQFHLLEKMKMKETAKCLESLLSSVSSSIHLSTEHLADWCKVAKVQRVQTEIEEADLQKHKMLLQSFHNKLAETEDSYHHTLSDLLGVVKDQRLQYNQMQIANTEANSDLTGQNESRVSHSSCKSHKDDANRARVRLSMKQLHEAQTEVIRLLEQNGSIIKQFQEIAKETLQKP